MIASLDTDVLIYALQDPNSTKNPGVSTEDLEKRQRARILLYELQSKNIQIMVSTVVIAEYLCKIDSKRHADVILLFQNQFGHIPIFDVRASAKAAELFQLHRGLPKAEQIERRYLKLDVMVVAAVAVAGAKVFYSLDPKCRKLARLAGMEPKDLPTHSTDLFIDKKVREGKDPHAD